MKYQITIQEPGKPTITCPVKFERWEDALEASIHYRETSRLGLLATVKIQEVK